jgi:Peptidase family M1 domain
MLIFRPIYSLILFCCASFASSIHADINYDISHNQDKMHVTANFGKQQTNKIKLYVPEKIWGTDYSLQIQNIKVKHGGYNPKNSTATIKQNENLVVEYDIINLPKREFIKEFGNKYYHYLDSTKFYILGLGFFVYPEDLKDEDIARNVTLTIKSPVQKIVYTKPPYFYDKQVQIDFRELPDILILGHADFGYHNDPINRINIIAWSDDQALSARLKDIPYNALKQQKEFWQDAGFDQLAVFILNPFNVNSDSWGGTVIKNTAIHFIHSKQSEDKGLDHLISHEGLHFWFGKLIEGPTWFREGFADYYSDKIKYLNDKEVLVKKYNKKLSAYFLSPLHALSNKQIEKKFFELEVVEKLPYTRGYIIAGQFDSIIDLDVVLRSMIRDCRASTAPCNFSKDFLLKYIADASVEDINSINKFFKPFSVNALSPYFLKKFPLRAQEVENFKYDLDIVKTVQDSFVSGRYLNKLDQGYKKDKIYKLSNITKGDQNNLYFFVENDNNLSQEFFPTRVPAAIVIPYYFLDGG